MPGLFFFSFEAFYPSAKYWSQKDIKNIAKSISAIYKHFMLLQMRGKIFYKLWSNFSSDREEMQK